MVDLTILAEGLAFPEGPIVDVDGSVIVVELLKGELTRIANDGTLQCVAVTGGSPNGLAFGPGGAIYVCNSGGVAMREWQGMRLPGGPSDDYVAGSIQRVDAATGAVEMLYAEAENAPLRAPNDLVFDADGGFWFTDYGKLRTRDKDVCGVFYARADGSSCREVIFPLDGPNGVGLSPDSKTLYVAETPSGTLWAFDIVAPGEVALTPRFRRMTGRFVHKTGCERYFDSLAVEASGNICVATLGEGGISVIDPAGALVEFVATGDPFTTNIAFGGADLSTAYITLGGTGRLACMAWPRPGLALVHG